MNFVAADLGASSTRYVSDSGRISVLPNNYEMLEPGFVTALESNSEEIEHNLEVTIEKEGTSSYFPATFLVGKMAERHTVNFITPDINLNKRVQPINYLSAVLSVAVSKVKYGLDDDIMLLLDVPPIEKAKAAEVFSNELVGKYKVTFPKYMGGTTVEFNISNVQVFEESVMAMASFFFAMTGVPREEARKYMTGKVLSLDIGASTSDLAIISDGKFLDVTGRTVKVGGNVARDTFINLVIEEEGYQIPNADAERAIAEGRIVSGSGYTNVGELVTEAKKDLAKKIVAQLNTYFTNINTPIKSIKAIVVSGGGSMEGQYVDENGEIIKTSEPLSKFVTEELKKISPNTEVVAYGEDARFANVKGLFIRGKVIMAKIAMANREKAAMANAAVQPAQAAPAAAPVSAKPVPPAAPVI